MRMGDWRQNAGPFTWQANTCHLGTLLLAHAGTVQPRTAVAHTEHASVAVTASKHATRRRNPWGNISYADLIATAIDSAPDKRLTLAQIYDWIVLNVPYFRDKADNSSAAGWKNSIRHNLSLHSRFVRVLGEGAGKCSWWTVNAADAKAAARRRRCESALLVRPPICLSAKLAATKDTNKNCANKLWTHPILQSHADRYNTTVDCRLGYLPSSPPTGDLHSRSGSKHCSYWSPACQTSSYNAANGSGLSKVITEGTQGLSVSCPVGYTSATMATSQLDSSPLALRHSVEYSTSLSRGDTCSRRQVNLYVNVTKTSSDQVMRRNDPCNDLYSDQHNEQQKRLQLGDVPASLYNSSLMCSTPHGQSTLMSPTLVPPSLSTKASPTPVAAVPVQAVAPMFNTDTLQCAWRYRRDVVSGSKVSDRPLQTQARLLQSAGYTHRCAEDLDAALGELQVAGLECDVSRILCDGNFDTNIDL